MQELMSLLELRLKKYIHQYSFLESELAETQHMFVEYNKQFKIDFKEAISAALQKHSSSVISNEFPQQQPEIAPKTPGINLLNKLFRKIALKVHPDKSKDVSPEIFCKLEQHYRDQDLLKLLLLAAETGTPVDGNCLDSEDFNAFETNIIKLQDKIDKIKNSLAWTWCTAADNEKPMLRVSMLNLIQADQSVAE